jgi:hypothetical protein
MSHSTSTAGDGPSGTEQRLAEALEALERLVDRHERFGKGASAGVAGPLVDAATLGRELGVSRQFVYDHAEELGVLRLGSGRRPRLRFDLKVAKRLCRQGVNGPASSAASPQAAGAGSRHAARPDLLPIRGGLI